MLDDKLRMHDAGVSAFRGKNAGDSGELGAFLTLCRQGLVPEGSYLLVESLDRISRMTPRRVSRLLDDIVDAGVTLVTLSDGQEYDADRLSSEPMALLVTLMVSWRAHEESKTKAQRLSAAWAEKRRKVREGESAHLTAKGPSWLEWTPEGWRERTPHADTVRRVYQMTLAGMGEHAIAATFNSEAVPVMGRGRMWHRSTISKLLRSPSVVGTLVPGKMDHSEGKVSRTLEEPVPNAFPAIISEAQWSAVRALKDGKAPGVRGRAASAPLSNLFASLARCPECGATMTRVMKGSGPKGGKPKLVCTRAKSGAADHPYRSVELAKLHDAFALHWQELTHDIPAGRAGEGIDEEHAALLAAIDGTIDQLAELEAAYRRKPSSVLASRMRALEASVRSYRADAERLDYERGLVDHGLATARVDALHAAMETEDDGEGRMDLAKVNAALRAVFEGITVDYRTGTLRFRWRQGGETEFVYAWVER